jgi:hypothetical protein
MSQPRCPLTYQQECDFICRLERQLEFHQLFMPVRHQLAYQLEYLSTHQREFQLMFRLESQRKFQQVCLLVRQLSFTVRSCSMRMELSYSSWTGAPVRIWGGGGVSAECSGW